MVQNNDLENAKVSVMEILENSPESAHANYILAQILEKSEEYDKAVETCLKILSLPKQDLPDKFFLSVSMFSLTVSHNSEEESLMEKVASE